MLILIAYFIDFSANNNNMLLKFVFFVCIMLGA